MSNSPKKNSELKEDELTKVQEAASHFAEQLRAAGFEIDTPQIRRGPSKRFDVGPPRKAQVNIGGRENEDEAVIDSMEGARRNLYENPTAGSTIFRKATVQVPGVEAEANERPVPREGRADLRDSSAEGHFSPFRPQVTDMSHDDHLASWRREANLGDVPGRRFTDASHDDAPGRRFTDASQGDMPGKRLTDASHDELAAFTSRPRARPLLSREGGAGTSLSTEKDPHHSPPAPDEASSGSAAGVTGEGLESTFVVSSNDQSQSSSDAIVARISRLDGSWVLARDTPTSASGVVRPTPRRYGSENTSRKESEDGPTLEAGTSVLGNKETPEPSDSFSQGTRWRYPSGSTLQPEAGSSGVQGKVDHWVDEGRSVHTSTIGKVEEPSLANIPSPMHLDPESMTTQDTYIQDAAQASPASASLIEEGGMHVGSGRMSLRDRVRAALKKEQKVPAVGAETLPSNRRKINRAGGNSVRKSISQDPNMQGEPIRTQEPRVKGALLANPVGKDTVGTETERQTRKRQKDTISAKKDDAKSTSVPGSSKKYSKSSAVPAEVMQSHSKRKSLSRGEDFDPTLLSQTPNPSVSGKASLSPRVSAMAARFDIFHSNAVEDGGPSEGKAERRPVRKRAQIAVTDGEGRSTLLPRSENARRKAHGRRVSLEEPTRPFRSSNTRSRRSRDGGSGQSWDGEHSEHSQLERLSDPRRRLSVDQALEGGSTGLGESPRSSAGMMLVTRPAQARAADSEATRPSAAESTNGTEHATVDGRDSAGRQFIEITVPQTATLHRESELGRDPVPHGNIEEHSMPPLTLRSLYNTRGNNEKRESGRKDQQQIGRETSGRQRSYPAASKPQATKEARVPGQSSRRAPRIPISQSNVFSPEVTILSGSQGLNSAGDAVSAAADSRTIDLHMREVLRENPEAFRPPPLLYLPVTTGTTRLCAVIDTAAHGSFITLAAVRRAGLRQLVDLRFASGGGAGGMSGVVGRIHRCELVIGETRIVSSLAVSDSGGRGRGAGTLPDMILGADVLLKNGAVVDLKKKRFVLGSDKIRIRLGSL